MQTNLKTENKLDFGRRPFKSVSEVSKAIDMWLDLKQVSTSKNSGAAIYDSAGRNLNKLGEPTRHGFTDEMIDRNIQACYLILQGMLDSSLDLYAPSSKTSTKADNQGKSPARVKEKVQEENSAKEIKHPAAQKAEEQAKQKTEETDTDKFKLNTMLKREFTMESLAQLVYDSVREGTAADKGRVSKAVPVLLAREDKKNLIDRPKRFEKAEANDWYQSRYNLAVEELQKELNLDNKEEKTNETQNSTPDASKGESTKKVQKSENEAKKGQKEGATSYDPALAREKETAEFTKAIALHLKENEGYITKPAFYVELVPGGSSVSAFLTNNQLSNSETNNKFIEDIAKSVGVEYKGVLADPNNKLAAVNIKAKEVEDAEIISTTEEKSEDKAAEIKGKFNFESVFNSKLLKFLQLGSKSKAGQALRQEMAKHDEFKTPKGKLDKHKAKVLTQEAFKRYDEIEKAKKEGKTADFKEEEAKIEAKEPALQEIKDMSAEDFTQHLIDSISKGETRSALEDAKLYFTPQGWDDDQIMVELQKYGYPVEKSTEEKTENKKEEEKVDKSWLEWDEPKFRGYFFEGTKRNFMTPKAISEFESQAVEYLKNKKQDISNDEIDKWIEAAKYKKKEKAAVDAETNLKDKEPETEKVSETTTEVPEKYQGLTNLSLSKSAFKKLIKEFLKEVRDLRAAYELARPWYNKHYTDKSDKAFYQWVNTYAEAVGVDTKKS